MESLTSEFGMGSGVPSPLWLPKKFQCIFWNLTALRSASCLVMGQMPTPVALGWRALSHSKISTEM